MTIRRDVREPISEVVIGDLGELRAVRFDPPNLHEPRSVAIEVNVLSVRRILRAVIEAVAGGQAFLLATLSRNREDSIAQISLGAVGKSLPIGRPSVPERRGIFGDEPGFATLDR